eukprot:SM000098S25142  [mRNA]  locus=s98:452744:455135:+ [translate_table: standard]
MAAAAAAAIAAAASAAAASGPPAGAAFRQPLCYAGRPASPHGLRRSPPAAALRRWYSAAARGIVPSGRWLQRRRHWQSEAGVKEGMVEMNEEDDAAAVLEEGTIKTFAQYPSNLVQVVRREAVDGKALGPSSRKSFKNREILVQHLLLPEEQAQQLLQLETRIHQEGIDLGDLASEFSICPSKDEGGLLGWISKGKTVPEFEAAAFSAPINKLTRVKTKFGWHLLQVLSEREGSMLCQISVEDFAHLLEEPNSMDNVQLIDVREPSEIETASIKGFKPFPLSSFGLWGPTITRDLDPEKETYVLGFKQLYNVAGGIDAYSRKVDSSVPLY